MTPDALHFVFVLAAWVALPVLALAALVAHSRRRSRWSLLLLLGLVAVASGQAFQLLSPVDDLTYEEFRGIVVSSGELPLGWYAGSLIASAGLLAAAAGALGLALGLPRSSAG